MEPGRGGKTTWARGVFWHYKKEEFLDTFTRARARGRMCANLVRTMTNNICQILQNPTPKKGGSFVLQEQEITGAWTTTRGSQHHRIPHLKKRGVLLCKNREKTGAWTTIREWQYYKIPHLKKGARLGQGRQKCFFQKVRFCEVFYVMTFERPRVTQISSFLRFSKAASWVM